MRNRTKLPIIYLTVFLIITYIPIILTVIYSFNESKITSVWGGWSLSWYQQLLHDRDIKEALINSLVLAFLSCMAAVFIGTLGAIGMTKIKRKANGFVEYFSMIPIMIPEIILGMVFLATFSFMGLPFGMTTLVIAHTSFCIPYIFMMVRASLIGMDISIEEAARDLGASSIRVFFDITFPLIRPAVLSGMLLSFAMSFDDVVISIFVTGPKVNTLPIKIYTRLKTGVTPEINALASIMLAVTVILLVLSGQINKRRR
ncbi:ABC transporter permease subunit [Anaerocolumna sedimenticola]|uniref:ABC transporter permease subunit n=1 Tax=Anaerocolumna sedimenticola TaxID=2696063 RepID=A0A6P1TIA3_9FIRM|nr:ABC transporter permease [Anaerocolumna sedimenticola]QHQ60940.1 ABC transporter permease subunit [Anaerocolumna sedimenticola]